MSLVFVGLACFFVVAAGAGFLWNKTQIHSLGEQIRGYESRLDQAKRHRMTLERTYAAMCSPADLEDRVRRMRLDLRPPQPDQIVRLPEKAGTGQEERLIAGRTTPVEEGRN